MTIGTFPGLRQTLEYTVRMTVGNSPPAWLRMTLGTFQGIRQTLDHTIMAKDDCKYCSKAQPDPSVHCYG